MKNNQPARALHWREYGCEVLGTALLCIGGLSAVTFDFGKGLPMEIWFPSYRLRLLITGLLFSGSGSLIAISALGKVSGAHLNPSVTLAFWVQRKMHRWDAMLYMVSQFLGATIGAGAIWAIWGSYASSVKFGVTLPGARFGVWRAFGAEFLMTWFYITLIFYFVSHKSLMKKTPLMNWIVIAVFVWLEAPVSGTSLNAARSFGPALIAHIWSWQWLYFVAPALGAVLAALTYPVLHTGKVLTGKLFHSAEYPSLFKNVPSPSELDDAPIDWD
jgi:aquaporin Z